MSRKFVLVMALLMIVPLLLAACGGSDMEPADAEKGLEAVFKGDFDEAEKYLCDEEIESAKGSDSAVPEGTEVDATCEKDGDAMSCVVSVAGVEIPAARFNIKDGKLCGQAD